MIGVIAPGSDPRVVSEFFELFKTPWERFQPGHRYDVLLCVGDVEFDCSSANLIVHYANGPLAIDAVEKQCPNLHNETQIVVMGNRSLVLFREHVAFSTQSHENNREGGSKHWSYRCFREGAVVHRVGYDLFAEITELLTRGQAAQFALLPTIDIHIALLREMIVESGVELTEIPPVPQGYGCIACLTHDIDHPAIKNHRWDATALGFVFRATIGSMLDLVRGRRGMRSVMRNLVAALKLPFVYASWARDCWGGFEERYAETERGLPSTYFVIPFQGVPGRTAFGEAPKMRAAGYGAKAISSALQRIRNSGCEVGTHGIDAWIDATDAEKEMQEVRNAAGAHEGGVRMHWLYFEDQSPARLEQGGASYDSTLGYRDAVGFRCGTAQAFRPLSAEGLLELPLIIMDTALFYPSYMRLTQAEAVPVMRELLAKMTEFGGCLTVNWHDRSLAPERQWRESYETLLEKLKQQAAWFATASQAVAWFRKRRSAKFTADGGLTFSSPAETDALPPLRVRRYNCAASSAKAHDLPQWGESTLDRSPASEILSVRLIKDSLLTN